MSHLSQLQLSMLADGALEASEATELRTHMAACNSCQARLADMQDESQSFAVALSAEVESIDQAVAIPKFHQPLTLRGFAFANLLTGLAIWLAQFLWKSVFGELAINATAWFTSLYFPDVYALTSATALYLLEEGTAMFDAYFALVVVSVSTIALLWLLLRYRKTRAAVTGCLVVGMAAAGVTLLPTPAHALELRQHDELLTISKNETIDDTLLIAAETILIEGNINGDVVAVGRRIEVSGNVQGNLLTFAEVITVSGQVGGMAVGAASSYDLQGASVAGDVWAAGEKLTIDGDSAVGRNATLASESAVVGGTVGQDLYAFAETVELTGAVSRNLEAFANRVRLLGDARVGSDVRFRSGNEERLHRSDGAQVGGQIEFLDMPDELQDKSRYATAEFYLWQLAWLVGAFVTGLAFLWLVPGVQYVALGAGTQMLKTAGIGFLALVSVPIMAVIVGITLVGLPLSLIALACWWLSIYLAKILVAAMVGHMLLAENASLVKNLLVGLAIVVVAINLPFIGGVISFLLTIIGLGLLLQYLFEAFNSRQPGADDMQSA